MTCIEENNMYKALEQKNSDEKNVTLKVSLTSVAKKTLITFQFQFQFIRVIRSMPETVFMRVTALFRPVCSSFGELVSEISNSKSQNQISPGHSRAREDWWTND